MTDTYRKRKPRAIKNCVQCGTKVEIYHEAQKRCKPCQRRYKNTKPKLYSVACNRCGEQFNPRNNKAKTCKSCQDYFPCAICGEKTKRTSPSKKYCSKKCQNTAKAEKYYDGNYRATLERDNNQCVRCGSTHRLHVHHIDYSGYGLKGGTANNDLENLVTFCERCHTEAHNFVNRTLVQKYLPEVRDMIEEFIKEAPNG